MVCFFFIHHTFILFFFAFFQLIKYLLCVGPGPFIFWSGFGAVVGSVRWLNSAISDYAVFGFVAGDRGLGPGLVLCAPVRFWLCSLATKLGLSCSHTAPIHSEAAHSIESGLCGGWWQCQECLSFWEKMVFGCACCSPSLPLKAAV